MIRRAIISVIRGENFWYLFSALCLLNILSLYAVNDIIITDPRYFTGGNENSAGLYRKIYLIIYVIYPVVCMVRVFVVAGLLHYGVRCIKLMDIPFRQLLTLAVLGEIVFWINDLAKVVWFLFVHTDYTMQEVEHFTFFSLKYFTSYSTGTALKTILSFFSLAELLFWIVLVQGMQVLTGEPLRRMTKLVAATYGFTTLGLLLLRSYLQYKMSFIGN
jgi:hypothetical protein